MVDSAIIMIENAHKALEHFRDENGREPTGAERVEVIIAAAKSRHSVKSAVASLCRRTAQTKPRKVRVALFC